MRTVLTGYHRNEAYHCSRCRGLARPINGSLSERFNLAVGIDLGIVDSFCYLGDTIDAGGGCEASVTARIRAGWGKFCQMLPLHYISSTTILEKLGLVDIYATLSQNRLRWFGHVSRNTKSINEAMKLDVVGHRGRGRPKKTWADCVKNDRKVWKMKN